MKNLFQSLTEISLIWNLWAFSSYKYLEGMLIQAGMARQKIYDIDEIKRSSAVAERARDAATVTAPAWHV